MSPVSRTKYEKVFLGYKSVLLLQEIVPLHFPMKEKEGQLDLKDDHAFKIPFKETDLCKL